MKELDLIDRLPGVFDRAFSAFETQWRLQQPEEALRESEEKYRTLYESMVHGVFYQIADGTFVDINPAGLKILGITRDQLVDRSIYHLEWKVVDEEHNILKPEEHPSMLALKTGQDVDSVVGVFNPVEKEYKWLIISAKPQFKPGEDKPHQGFSTLHDITDRKRAEDSLRESKTFLDNLTDIAYMSDTEGNVTWVNSAKKKLPDFPLKKLSESPFCLCLPMMTMPLFPKCVQEP